MDNQIIQLPNFVWGKFVEFNKLDNTYRIIEDGFRVVAGSGEFTEDWYKDFYKIIPNDVIGKLTGRENKNEVDVYSLSLLKEYCVWSHYYYPIPEGENHRSFIAQHHFLIPKTLFIRDTRIILFALLSGLADKSENYEKESHFLDTVQSYKTLQPFELHLLSQSEIEGYTRRVLEHYLLQEQKDYCLLRSMLNLLNGGNVVGITGINQTISWRLIVLSGIVATLSTEALQEFSFSTHSYLTANQRDYKLRFWESGYLPDAVFIQKINYETFNCNSHLPAGNNQDWGDMLISMRDDSCDLDILAKEICEGDPQSGKTLRQRVKEKTLYKHAHQEHSDIEEMLKYLLSCNDVEQEFDLYIKFLKEIRKLDLEKLVSVLNSPDFVAISGKFIVLSFDFNDLFETISKIDFKSRYTFFYSLFGRIERDKYPEEFLVKASIYINDWAVNIWKTEESEDKFFGTLDLLDQLYKEPSKEKLGVLLNAYSQKQKDVLLRRILRVVLGSDRLVSINIPVSTLQSDLLLAYTYSVDNKALEANKLKGIIDDDLILLVKLGLKFKQYKFLSPELLAKVFVHERSSIASELSSWQWSSFDDVSISLLFGTFVLLNQMSNSNSSYQPDLSLVKIINEQNFIAGSVRYARSLLDIGVDAKEVEQSLGKIIQHTMSIGWHLDIWKKALMENGLDSVTFTSTVERIQLPYSEKERVIKWVQDNQKILTSATSQPVLDHVIRLSISAIRLSVDLGDRDFVSHANWINSILKIIGKTEENINTLKRDIGNSFPDYGDALLQNISSVSSIKVSSINSGQTKNYAKQKQGEISVDMNNSIHYINIALSLINQGQPLNSIRESNILHKPEYMLKLWHALLLVGDQKTAILTYRKIFDMLGGQSFDNGKELRNELVGELSKENLNILAWLQNVMKGESDHLKKQQSNSQKKKTWFELPNPFKKSDDKNKPDDKNKTEEEW